MNQMKIEYLPVASLHPYERNAKQHPPEQVEHIANSIREFGFRQPLVVDAENVVVIGHGRLMAAEKLGLDTVPVVRADDLSEAQIKALRLADNKTNESGWEFDKLEEELDELSADFDMSDFGFERAEDETIPTDGEKVGSMADKYLVPPFSIIYGNKPDWLARKRAWVSFGIRSEIGRGGETYLQFKEQSRGKLHTPRGGGYRQAEMSKAFKNNTKLNSYMTGRRRSQPSQ
jgi:hypothetical protein